MQYLHWIRVADMPRTRYSPNNRRFFQELPSDGLMQKQPSLILDNHERHYRFSELSSLLPDEPDPKTIWMWCYDKERKIHMENIEGPGGHRSSVEAYHRFIRELNPKGKS